MNKIKKTLQSRKAWACLFALALIILNHALGWGLGVVEMLGIVSPLLAWAGIEGVIDAARVFQEGKPRIDTLIDGVKDLMGPLLSSGPSTSPFVSTGAFATPVGEGENENIQSELISRSADQMSDEELGVNIGFYKTILDDLEIEQKKRDRKKDETG